jgi:hypothetical protein
LGCGGEGGREGRKVGVREGRKEEVVGAGGDKSETRSRGGGGKQWCGGEESETQSCGGVDSGKGGVCRERGVWGKREWDLVLWQWWRDWGEDVWGEKKVESKGNRGVVKKD